MQLKLFFYWDEEGEKKNQVLQYFAGSRLLDAAAEAAERTGRTFLCIIVQRPRALSSIRGVQRSLSVSTDLLFIKHHVSQLIVSWISNIQHNIIGTSTTVKVMRSTPHAHTHTHTFYEILFITTETNKFDFSSELFTGADWYCFHRKPIKRHRADVLIMLADATNTLNNQTAAVFHDWINIQRDICTGGR